VLFFHFSKKKICPKLSFLVVAHEPEIFILVLIQRNIIKLKLNAYFIWEWFWKQSCATKHEGVPFYKKWLLASPASRLLRFSGIIYFKSCSVSLHLESQDIDLYICFTYIAKTTTLMILLYFQKAWRNRRFPPKTWARSSARWPTSGQEPFIL